MTSAVQLTINAGLGQAPITAIVSTRIRPFPLPQGEGLPALAVALSSEEQEYLLSGSSEYPVSGVVIHCIGRTAKEAIDLGEIVKGSFQNLLYTSSDSPPVKASFQKDGVDFTDFADDLSTHRRVMAFSLRWR